MTDDIALRPLVLTDDEVMALAAVSGQAWWSALRTVDVTDEHDMIRASGRGLRSLAVRGLVTDEGGPLAALSVATACLGAKPWATAAAVDDRDQIPVEAPIFCLFRAEGRLIACRSDVSGTHVLHEVDLEHAVELVSDQLSGEGGSDVAVAFWSSDQNPQGGMRRRGSECFRVDSDGGQLGTSVEPGSLNEAVRSFWTV